MRWLVNVPVVLMSLIIKRNLTLQTRPASALESNNMLWLASLGIH